MLSAFYHRSLHITSEEKWRRDNNRQQYLQERGYFFRSFWEQDINNDLALVKREVEQLFNTSAET